MVIHAPPRFSIVCAVVLVLACLAAGCSSSQTPAQPSPAIPVPAGPADTITISNFAFSPATLTVKAGTTVTWTNEDSAPHTVVSDANAPVPFTSPSLATGSSFPFTFTQAGTYSYHCSIHPSMKGTVVVEP
ncbi:MAG: cupredoxin domain-containing protein [Methanoregula sp.]|nr:cupredoxin domain-containing protein [Methanoregula sp.]